MQRVQAPSQRRAGRRDGERRAHAPGGLDEDEIGIGRPFVHISGRYPTERGCLAVVWPLAPHPTNRNELVVWDLAADPSEPRYVASGTVAGSIKDQFSLDERNGARQIHVGWTPSSDDVAAKGEARTAAQKAALRLDA